MNDPLEVYDYYLIAAYGRLVSATARAAYDLTGHRSPRPEEPDQLPDGSNNPHAGKVHAQAVGTKLKLKPNQSPDSLVFHDRLTTKLTPTEYEDLYGGFPSQAQGVMCCRSAYKIIDTGGGVMDYDWIIIPDFTKFEPYLPDIITYDVDGVETSRRRPVAGESFLPGYGGSDPISV